MNRVFFFNRFFCHSLLCVLLNIVSASIVQAQWQQHEFSSMGTKMHVSVWHEKADKRQAAIDTVAREMQRLDALLSFYQPQSALMQMNAKAGLGPVSVPDELFYILTTAQRISVLSGGAFDVTIGSVGALYDLRAEVAPAKEQLTQVMTAVNYQHVVLDKRQRTVSFKHPEVKVDLGGIAKGYAVDRCIELIAQLGIEQAQVTAGGDTRFLGSYGDRPWWVGIRHPRDESQSALVLPLESRAISTSGDYERFFMSEGERVHHILNPGTGTPSNTLISVSILSEHSVWADALATAVFVLGGPEGLALINQMPEVDAIMIDQSGQVFYSDGFESLNMAQSSIEIAMPEQSPLP